VAFVVVLLHYQMNCRSLDQVKELIDDPDVPSAENGHIPFLQRGDVDILYIHLSFTGLINAAKYMKQCGFARTAITDHGYLVASFQR